MCKALIELQCRLLDTEQGRLRLRAQPGRGHSADGSSLDLHLRAEKRSPTIPDAPASCACPRLTTAVTPTRVRAAPVPAGPDGAVDSCPDDGKARKVGDHEVLVYRVGDKYVIDSRQLRDSDDVVVDASSVSVVSVRPDTEVEVSFTVNSKDASVFTVSVTFVCSVTEPDVVVRDGQLNVADTGHAAHPPDSGGRARPIRRPPRTARRG